jgi:hypothetical protein
MRSPNFWSWAAARPPDGRLPQGLDYLDRFDRPVGILETGCVRQQGN